MTYSCKDPESRLELILHLDVVEHNYNYHFRSADGEETDPITVSETQFLQQTIHLSCGQREVRFGMNLLRDEVNKRREAKLKAMSPLERAQKTLTEKWPYGENERILLVLGCIVEHLIAIDKPK